MADKLVRGLRLAQGFTRDLAEIWSVEGRGAMLHTAKTNQVGYSTGR